MAAQFPESWPEASMNMHPNRPCRYCGADICYTHCIYCLTDCDMDCSEHGPACPQITGQFPQAEEGVCVRCDAPLRVGSMTYRIEVGHGDWQGQEVPVFEVVCLSCKSEFELAGE
jgi:hypothetical protein